jgi:hypothetical protein
VGTSLLSAELCVGEIMTEKIIMSFRWTHSNGFMKWTLTKDKRVRMSMDNDKRGRIVTKAALDGMRHHLVDNSVTCIMYFNAYAYERVRKD